MPRSRKPFAANPDGCAKAAAWFASNSSHPDGIGDWDAKTERLGEAIMNTLACGSAIMFGVTRDGSAVSVTIYTGDDKSRVYVSDSIELDDLTDSINDQALRHLGKREPRQIRVVGE
jgi:hypothetical protein